MTITPHFSSIRKELLSELLIAKHEIRIAVCWFTNEELFNALLQKLEEGQGVKLIILDDYINSNPDGCNFQRYIDLGGELYLSAIDQPMHNKYCIIDDKTVITGSYNWTYYAEDRNDENIIIIRNEDSVTAQYISDFERIKDRLAPATTFIKQQSTYISPVLENQAISKHAFSLTTMLANDLFFKGIATMNELLYRKAKSILPENINFQKKAVALKWERQCELSSTLSFMIVNDLTSLIAEKGTKLPFEVVKNYTTVSDNQISMSCQILKGESNKASKNEMIKQFEVKDIPEMDAGKPTVKTEYRITMDGILYIVVHVHDTGKTITDYIDLKKIPDLVI